MNAAHGKGKHYSGVGRAVQGYVELSDAQCKRAWEAHYIDGVSWAVLSRRFSVAASRLATRVDAWASERATSAR